MASSIWNLWGLLGSTEEGNKNETTESIGRAKLFQFIESRYDVHNPTLKNEISVGRLEHLRKVVPLMAKLSDEFAGNQHLKSIMSSVASSTDDTGNKYRKIKAELFEFDNGAKLTLIIPVERFSDKMDNLRGSYHFESSDTSENFSFSYIGSNSSFAATEIEDSLHSLFIDSSCQYFNEQFEL